MTNLLVILILALVLSLAVRYILRAKKSGAKCIGCPSGGHCPAKGQGNCTCQGDPDDKSSL